MISERQLLCIMAAILHAGSSRDAAYSVAIAKELYEACDMAEREGPIDIDAPHCFQPPAARHSVYRGHCVLCLQVEKHAIHGWAGD